MHLPTPAQRRGVDPRYPAVGAAFEKASTRPLRSRFATVAALIVSVAFHAAPALAQAADTPRAITPDPLRYVSPSRTYDTEHTAVDLDVDLQKRRIAGNVTHTVRALRDQLAEVRMNCVGLVVDSVTVNGRRARFEYPVAANQSTSWLAGASAGTADDQLVVACDPPLARGAEAQVRVYYSGSPEDRPLLDSTREGHSRQALRGMVAGRGRRQPLLDPVQRLPQRQGDVRGTLTECRRVTRRFRTAR